MPTSATANDQATQVNTDGGPSIGHDVNIDKGDFVGRDKIEHHHHYHDSVQLPSPTTPRGIFGLYPFNQHFFGRDDELATLHTLLQTESNVSICPVITGMGGLGKTQLAAHYAHDHKDDYPDGIFWITAANLNEIRPQLADFCVALSLPVADPQRSGDLTEQKITAFKGYLDNHPHALLIFDNVEEPDHLLTRQISVQITALALGGKVITTTRRRNLPGDKFAELALQRLLPEPARQILTTARLNLATDPDLDRLCEQFGYLPLMLNLAAAALKKRGGAIAGYLQRLQTLGAEKLHSEVAKVSLDDYHQSLNAVLNEQWAMLHDENARLLLRVAGQLPEAAVIPTVRLGLLAGLADVDEWERPLSDALNELETASLIERTDSNTVHLHPLVGDFAAALTPSSECAAFRTVCAQRLADAYTLDEAGLRRLGNEYAARGIAALLLDLITALALFPNNYAPDSTLAIRYSQLTSLLRLLRLEANKLQGTPLTWRPQRLWQQLMLHTDPTATSKLVPLLLQIMQQTWHWLPVWGHQHQVLTLEQTFVGHKERVNAVAVISSTRIVSASDDHTLKIWNLDSGELEQTLRGHDDWVRAVAVISSTRIVSASEDHTVKIWDLRTGEVEQILTGHTDEVNGVAVLNEQHIVSTSNDGTLKIWNLSTSEVEQTLEGRKDGMCAMTVLDDQHIVLASVDHTLNIWNLKTGLIEQTFSGHKAEILVLAVLDNQRIISASRDYTLKIWNLETGQIEQTLAGHGVCVTAIAVLNSQRIVSAAGIWGGKDYTLKIWNLAIGKIEQTLTGHEANVNAVAVVDGTRFISAGGGIWNDDCTLKVWNLAHSNIEHTSRHKDRVNAVAMMNGTLVLSASDDRTLKVWDLYTGEVKQTLIGHTRKVTDVDIVDEQRIVSVSRDRTLKVWNIYTGEVEQTLIGHMDKINAVSVLNGTRIVSAAGGIGRIDGTIKVWNLNTGEVERTFIGHNDRINDVAVVDDTYIVSASNDHTLKVWNIQTGKVEHTLAGHKDWVTTVAIVDTQQVVSAARGIRGHDMSFKVWNLQTGAIKQTFTGHEGAVNDVAVLDGQYIFSISDDRTIKVWNLETSKEITSIGLDGTPQSVAVARQGSRILVVVGDALGALYCLELVEPVGRAQ